MSDISGIDKNLFQSLGVKRPTDSLINKNELQQSDFIKLLNRELQETNSVLRPNGAQANTDKAENLNKQASHEDGFQSFYSTVQSKLALQASSLIGRSVLVPSNQFLLGGSEQVSFKTVLSETVKELHVVISTSEGTLVYEQTLGPQSKGACSFNWDGKDNQQHLMENGVYQLLFRGSSLANESIDFPCFVVSNINSVTLGQMGDGMLLNVANVGDVKLSDVLQLEE